MHEQESQLLLLCTNKECLDDLATGEIKMNLHKFFNTFFKISHTNFLIPFARLPRTRNEFTVSITCYKANI